MVEISMARATVGYGAGPVSVQLTRGRPLVEAPTESDSSGVVVPPRPGRDRNAYDRLALKHWPRGHRVLVCSLTGGTGRTTVAALLAATLAGLPFAHIWPPALLVDTTQRRSPHDHRDGTAETISEHRVDDLASLLGVRSPLQVQTTSSGIAVLRANSNERPILSRQLCTAVSIVQDCFAPVIIDARCGLASASMWTRGVPAGFSVVLVVRPDEYSLTDAAEALVWMHDQHLVSKQRVTVVVNHGAGPPTGRTRPAAAALAVRCRGLHHLPSDPRLGPDPIPPTARPVPARLRLRLAQICLDIWHTSQTPTQPLGPQTVDHPQENP